MNQQHNQNQKASAPETRTQLPAYRVIYADGESYITSMAKDVTLEMAKDYFVGESLEQHDGSMKRVAAVIEFRQDTPAASSKPQPASSEPPMQALYEGRDRLRDEHEQTASSKPQHSPTPDEVSRYTYKDIEKLISERDAARNQAAKLAEALHKLDMAHNHKTLCEAKEQARATLAEYEADKNGH